MSSSGKIIVTWRVPSTFKHHPQMINEARHLNKCSFKGDVFSCCIGGGGWYICLTFCTWNFIVNRGLIKENNCGFRALYFSTNILKNGHTLLIYFYIKLLTFLYYSSHFYTHILAASVSPVRKSSFKIISFSQSWSMLPKYPQNHTILLPLYIRSSYTQIIRFQHQTIFYLAC